MNASITDSLVNIQYIRLSTYIVFIVIQTLFSFFVIFKMKVQQCIEFQIHGHRTLVDEFPAKIITQSEHLIQAVKQNQSNLFHIVIVHYNPLTPWKRLEPKFQLDFDSEIYNYHVESSILIGQFPGRSTKIKLEDFLKEKENSPQYQNYAQIMKKKPV